MSHQVFNKLGVFVGAFGDEFFVRPFQQSSSQDADCSAIWISDSMLRPVRALARMLM